MLQIHIVKHPHQFDYLFQQIKSATFVAVDTEFHSENRFRPELMLIQICVQRGEVFLVDALSGLNLDPLGKLLGQKTIITHGGREDYRILYRETGLRAARVYDTQIMAGLLGWTYPMRLDHLIETSLEVKLNKGSTLSNWSTRPLTKQQINYAAEDANQLLPLFNQLKMLLVAESKYQLSETASIEYMENALRPKMPEDVWPYWSIAEGLNEVQRNVLNHLLTWREEIALEKDRPSNYILPNNMAIDLARRVPKSVAEIRENRKISGRLVSRFGNELIKCIQKGKRDTSRYRVLDSSARKTSKTLQLWSIAFSNMMSINPSLLLAERLSQQIAMFGAEDGLEGWRKSIIEAPLRDFLNGEAAICMDANGPTLTTIK
jgi:ribonuclease D